MTGKKYQVPKKDQFPSYRTRLSIIITAIFCIFIICISGVAYLFTVDHVNSDFHKLRLQTEKTFVSSALLTEYGLESSDAQYDFLLQDRTRSFLSAYQKHRHNLSSLDLETLKSTMSGDFEGDIELYILNKSGVIEYTTYKRDYLMDFSQYPDFYTALTKIRLGTGFKADPWIRDFSDPELYWKYGYLPTDDHEYLLEIGIRNENYSLMHRSIVSQLRNITGDALDIPNLVHVELYDKALRNRTIRLQDDGHDLTSVTGILTGNAIHDLLNQTFVSKQSSLLDNPGKKQLISVQYVDLSSMQSPSGAERSFIGILVFSTEPLERTLYFYTPAFIIVTVFFLVAGAFIARYLSAYISGPIEMLTEDVAIIASTTLDHPLRETKIFETEQLRASMNRMIASIREYIAKIEVQGISLKEELILRKKAELSLSHANTRLMQLSQITRHDILNQLTALQFFLDLIRESRHGPESEKYVEKAYQVLQNITELLNFTIDYEQIGLQGAAWQNIGLILDTYGEEFQDQITIRHSCQSVEILADPLVRKVLYNLIDNTIRHGKTADLIHVSFSESSGEGMLVYSDNGSGIASEEKEKIFYRGFGKGTGLGMAFIREVLESDGMTIRETGVEGQGVRFEIVIPKTQFRVSWIPRSSN